MQKNGKWTKARFLVDWNILKQMMSELAVFYMQPEMARKLLLCRSWRKLDEVVEQMQILSTREAHKLLRSDLIKARTLGLPLSTVYRTGRVVYATNGNKK